MLDGFMTLGVRLTYLPAAVNTFVDRNLRLNPTRRRARRPSEIAARVRAGRRRGWIGGACGRGRRTDPRHSFLPIALCRSWACTLVVIVYVPRESCPIQRMFPRRKHSCLGVPPWLLQRVAAGWHPILLAGQTARLTQSCERRSAIAHIRQIHGLRFGMP